MFVFNGKKQQHYSDISLTLYEWNMHKTKIGIQSPFANMLPSLMKRTVLRPVYSFVLLWLYILDTISFEYPRQDWNYQLFVRMESAVKSQVNFSLILCFCSTPPWFSVHFRAVHLADSQNPLDWIAFIYIGGEWACPFVFSWSYFICHNLHFGRHPSDTSWSLRCCS